MTNPSPRDYVRDTVIPALKLAGYSIIQFAHHHTYHIEVKHAGFKESIRVEADGYGQYRDCVSLVADNVWHAKPSKFVIDRSTGTANLTGIMATAKRLVKESKARCEAAAADKVREAEKTRLYAANLPLLEALAADLGLTVDVERESYYDWPARVDLGGLILRPSQGKADCVTVTTVAMMREGNTYTVTPTEARAFIDAYRALEAAHKG